MGDDVRIGLIARASNRGLSNQLWEFARHMHPTKTLIVDNTNDPYRIYPERFPDAKLVTWRGHRMCFEPHEDLDWLCSDIDVVFSAETTYDMHLIELCRERGIKTVVQGNYEFLYWVTEPELPRPDQFWAPSLWHIDKWPENTRHMPFPVNRTVLPFRLRTEAKTFLHVGGHQAMMDRNGTRMLSRAVRYIRQPLKLIVRTQSPLSQALFRGLPRNVDLEIRHDDTENYWDLYSEGDVLLLPRRFGGLSLVLNEASSTGMPVVCLNREPERDLVHPEAPIHSWRSRSFRVQSGEIGWHEAQPRDLANKIDKLAASPDMVEKFSLHSDAYAESISWERMKPVYLEAFEELCNSTSS